MVLIQEEYRHIFPNNLFTRMPNPGVLVPNLKGMATQIASAENNHWLTKKLYSETRLLERTFIQKIIEAIDTKYFAAVRNPVTGQIMPLVPTIPEYLHNNYGRITPQQLTTRPPLSKQ